MASGVSVRLFPEDIAIEICKHCRQFSPGRSDQHREVEVGESALSELGLHLLLSQSSRVQAPGPLQSHQDVHC